MTKLTLLSIPLLLCVISADAPQQKPTYPTPPPPLNTDNARPSPPETVRRRIDLAQLQHDADDLARTAQSIPTDVASVRQGMLPKDVIQKLKQIEKLSKRLRGELTP